MISVKTSNGRLGDWSEIMLAIVEVKDMKRLPYHERDWSVGSAPNATNRNYFLILMACGQPGSGENLMKSCWFSRAFCTRKNQTLIPHGTTIATHEIVDCDLFNTTD